MAYIEMNNVNIGFGPTSHRTEVLTNTNLHIEENEFLAIVGFSGSGKSTLINLLSGLQKPDSGEVLMDGQIIKEAGPERGVVFQNYSLLPWLTVAGNVDLAVKKVFPKMSKGERKDHVEKYIDMVSLTPALWKRPAELSGGMRQRVSIARTLAIQPKVLLMDEPFSALDALTRANLQDELTDIWTREKRTVVFITNDVDEAILMADRIVPLTPGPSATLGPSFDVDLARPRDRAAINHNMRFKEIRNSITEYLLDLREDEDSKKTNKDLKCPDLKPIDLRVMVA
jgi:nitrate/nitrite transport system ATP-binding protein